MKEAEEKGLLDKQTKENSNNATSLSNNIVSKETNIPSTDKNGNKIISTNATILVNNSPSKKEKNNPSKVNLFINLIDESNGKPLQGGTINLLKGNLSMISEKNNSNGTTIYQLEPDKYLVQIAAKGYVPFEDVIDLKNIKRGAKITYELKPVKIEKGITFKLKNINFETASDKLLPLSLKTLDIVAKTLIENPKMIVEVAGHTDDMAEDTYNQNLSDRRAKAVVKYLVLKGVKSQQMKAKGYGESQPIADNLSEEGRLQNRRVMFTVLEF